MTTIDFEGIMTADRLEDFAQYMKQLQHKIGFKISARGWCYQLESERVINKDQFAKVEGWINRCRRIGLLPIDFVAEDGKRAFSVVDEPDDGTPTEYFGNWLKSALRAGEWYSPDWWDGEEYYIQMLVEKIDLKTLFMPVCEAYHIPIATSSGWSSMRQRADYARRFQEAEERGLTCVLLYCGDHDPDGLRISDFLRSNLVDLQDVVWEDGTPGYDPEGLIIERFGLNFDFIERYRLTWIDNLITGSGKNLASPRHPNYMQDYVQDYLSTYGARKCEANAIVPMPQVARDFVEQVVRQYLGDDALDRFADKKQRSVDEVEQFIEDSGIGTHIRRVLRDIGV